MPPDAQDIADEERGVVYGTVEDEPLLLDVFRPPARATAQPAVVLVHGGGMWTGSRADMADPARQLAQAGYIAFAVDYRLVDVASGRHPWPAQLDDVQHAVRWVRANAARYGVDPERVGAYGWSAGGQLAALLGTRDTRDAASPTGGLPQPRGVRRRPGRRRGPGGVHESARPGRGRGPPGRDARAGARALSRYVAALLDRRADRSLPGLPRRPGRRGPGRAVAAAGVRPPRDRGRGGVRGTPRRRPWRSRPRPGSAQRRSRSSGTTCASATLTSVDPQAGYGSSTSQSVLSPDGSA